MKIEHVLAGFVPNRAVAPGASRRHLFEDHTLSAVPGDDVAQQPAKEVKT
jgi:hypothetical protein